MTVHSHDMLAKAALRAVAKADTAAVNDTDSVFGEDELLAVAGVPHGLMPHARRRIAEVILANADGARAEVLQWLRDSEPDPASVGMSVIPTSDLFLPLPPTKWVVEAMQIVSGRPALWAGYGSSAKTLSIQSSAVHLAAGRSVWGQFQCNGPKTFLHIDHEQGRFATLKRYQRLALGHGIDREELDDRLRVVVFPDVYLNSPDAESIYCRTVEGCDVVAIDALRGATPGLDENDSKIRSCLDLLTRVSEKTGAAFIVIHHAGKPKEGHSDARSVPRGSSAIFDACGSVFVLRTAKGEPIWVSHEKAAAESEGGHVEDFYLTIEDIPNGTNPRAGVRMVYQTKEQARPAVTGSSKFDALKVAILDVVRSDNPKSKNAICARVTGGNKNTMLQAINELLDDGLVVEMGGTYRVA